IDLQESINQINSLEHFGLCERLEELYIRQNEIQDLNQVVYLQSLPNLKNLWLGENPCASTEGYRFSVLRALPQLQKLDNLAVTPEELREAQRKGKALHHPDDPQESEQEEDVYVPQNQYRYQEQYQQEPEYSPQRSPSRQETEYENDEEEYYNNIREDPPEDDHLPEYSPPRQMSPPRRQQAEVPASKRSYSPEQEYSERRRSSYDQMSPKQLPQQYYDRSPVYTNSEESAPPQENNYRETRMVTSQSTNNIKEYTNGERYSHAPNSYRTEGSEISSRQDGPVRSSSQHNCNLAHRPPFSRRPVTRNSNILSAVLCLVKELDYPSLEVVEMAVRCRMDELDE
ncbi:PREDICTED: protein tilB homolog, partial [Nicrophorus vespilloides]|uniref:Protein tilB homolog n=1 Tax=Nicrophorus vespilloides TaxID=110193 RepID=A0ABM1MUB5_NICVS